MTQNELIGELQAQTADFLGTPDLNAQDLSVLTTIRNGGDAAALCLITILNT